MSRFSSYSMRLFSECNNSLKKTPIQAKLLSKCRRRMPSTRRWTNIRSSASGVRKVLPVCTTAARAPPCSLLCPRVSMWMSSSSCSSRKSVMCKRSAAACSAVSRGGAASGPGRAASCLDYGPDGGAIYRCALGLGV